MQTVPHVKCHYVNQIHHQSSSTDDPLSSCLGVKYVLPAQFFIGVNSQRSATDIELIGNTIRDICFDNAKNYFGMLGAEE